jgi:hypothetical protein
VRTGTGRPFTSTEPRTALPATCTGFSCPHWISATRCLAIAEKPE